MFCSIATKRLEKRCCTFYQQRSNLFCKQQQMSLLQVAWILTSNWVKLSGSRAIQVNYVTYCKTSLRWAGKTRNIYWFRCNKIELLSTFCNPFPQPVTNWFVARFVGNQTRNVAIRLALEQSNRTSCTFLLPVLPQLYPLHQQKECKPPVLRVIYALLTKCEVKMVGYYQSAGFFLSCQLG